jgi:hypothetical protein
VRRQEEPARPLIVEWPSADRAALEAQASHGLVVVRYEGCEMEVLRQCRVFHAVGKRVEARSETTLCIRCKEDQERMEKDYT